MSLCFKNPFQKENWNETEDTYDKILKQYLAGEIDLQEREKRLNTFELTNHVLKYWVLWNNGKNKTYDPSEYRWNFPKMSYIGFWSGRFFKCFSIEIPQKNLPLKGLKPFYLKSCY